MKILTKYGYAFATTAECEIGHDPKQFGHSVDYMGRPWRRSSPCMLQHHPEKVRERMIQIMFKAFDASTRMRKQQQNLAKPWDDEPWPHRVSQPGPHRLPECGYASTTAAKCRLAMMSS